MTTFHATESEGDPLHGTGIHVRTFMAEGAHDSSVCKMEVHVYPLPTALALTLTEDFRDAVLEVCKKHGLTNGDMTIIHPAGRPS